jgi:hypothetical protein
MKATQIMTTENPSLAEKLLIAAKTRIDDPQLMMILSMFEGNILSVPDEQIRDGIEQCIRFFTELLNE